jgi:hypothetical protein
MRDAGKAGVFDLPWDYALRGERGQPMISGRHVRHHFPESDIKDSSKDYITIQASITNYKYTNPRSRPRYQTSSL